MLTPIAVPQYVSQAAPQYAETVAAVTALDAYGLPNDNGSLAWPLGLRILPPAAESSLLLRQINVLLPSVAAQSLSSTVDKHQLRNLSRSLERLHGLLAARSTDLPHFTAAEAQRFLQQVDEAVKSMAE
jgi:hypothetical protein